MAESLGNHPTGGPLVALYAAVGPALMHFHVDVEAGTLSRTMTVFLPARVQYGCPHGSRRFLYVATSNAAGGVGPLGDTHHLTAFRIDVRTGALSPHGDP